jgi:hypothetical protein
MLVSESVSRQAKKTVWTKDIDPATIPVDVLVSQLERVPYEAILSLRGRKNVAKRTTYTGGIYWAKHNPDTKRCRCRMCMKKRELLKRQTKPGAKRKA